MNAEPWWETSFENLETSTFGKVTAEVEILNQQLAPGSKILDLGCADGRHGIYLAEHGHDVVMVDISPKGIRKVQHRAAVRGLKVTALQMDIRDYVFDQQFDAVLAHGILMLVKREEWAPILRNMQDHTKPGGFNLVAVLTDSEPPPEDLKNFLIGIFHEGELRTLYEGWSELFWERKRKIDRDQATIDRESGKERILTLNKIMARKPV